MTDWWAGSRSRYASRKIISPLGIQPERSRIRRDERSGRIRTNGPARSAKVIAAASDRKSAFLAQPMRRPIFCRPTKIRDSLARGRHGKRLVRERPSPAPARKDRASRAPRGRTRPFGSHKWTIHGRLWLNQAEASFRPAGRFARRLGAGWETARVQESSRRFRTPGRAPDFGDGARPRQRFLRRRERRFREARAFSVSSSRSRVR